MQNFTREEIIQELTFDLKKVVFGTYDAKTHEGDALTITEIEICNHLFDNLTTFDFEEALTEKKDMLKEELSYRIKEELYCESIDEIEETLELLTEVKAELERIENASFEELFEVSIGDANNTYNWGASATLVYESVILDDKKELVSVMFHRYGDVRGNYTEKVYFECSVQELLETMCECRKNTSIDIDGEEYQLSYSIMSEAGVIEVYNENLDIDRELYIDEEIGNLEEFKTSLKEKLGL